jgi:predicted amidohydrolase YtcJ
VARAAPVRRREVGKKADLVVLEQSLFDVEMSDIGETAVHLTMMNGNVTHRDGL